MAKPWSRRAFCARVLGPRARAQARACAMASEPITGLEVTYGAALPPTTFSKHVQVGCGALDDGAAGTATQVDLARGAGGGAYLWTARSGDEPVTAVAVLYGDEPLPDSGNSGGGVWRRVARDVCGGNGGVFLAYRVGGSEAALPGSPVAAAVAAGRKYEALATLSGSSSEGGGAGGPLLALRVISGFAEAAAAAASCSWTVIARPLSRSERNSSGSALYLALRYGAAASTAGTSAWAEALKPGDLVDCQDRARRWRAARVAAVSSDGARLTLSFKGWSAKYDEELPRVSKRLARPGAHTAGVDTRAVRRQGDAFDVDVGVLSSLELRIDDYISGDFPVEERVRSLLGAS